MTGIILAGGKSIRMGRNKAFIKVDGLPIVHRIYNLFQTLFDEIVIVTNQKDLFTDFYQAKIHEDIFPNRGAIVGLYTGLTFASHQYSFCVACDMPFLNQSLIQYLLEQRKNFDVIVPKTLDGLQPLHAVYSKQCLAPIEHIIKAGRHRIIDIYPEVNTKIIEEVELIKFDPDKKSFVNINTPDELDYFGNATKAF